MQTWIFFDLGSTFIDESACTEYRNKALLAQPGAPSREVLERYMHESAARNGLPYKDAAREFGLKMINWPKHLEKLYPSVPELLEKLSRKYKLGIIANQSLGTEERMKNFGIRQYFDVIVSSAEEGVEKPDPRIFQLALERAGCHPDEAWMIGDRLDNDIAPASGLGMKTIWVRQGWFAGGSVELIGCEPDVIVESIREVAELF